MNEFCAVAMRFTCRSDDNRCIREVSLAPFVECTRVPYVEGRLQCFDLHLGIVERIFGPLLLAVEITSMQEVDADVLAEVKAKVR
jgi:hypothetical protein